MRVLIVDQCSGSKDYREGCPVFTADEIDDQSRGDLLEREHVAAKKARSLYTGRQQGYIDDAVDALRESDHEVDRYFISAGFGLIEESRKLPPYDVTFNGMTREQIRLRADRLGISDDVRELVVGGSPYDIAFFALGNGYYACLDIEEIVESAPSNTYIVLFNQESVEKGRNNVISIPARTEDAKENGSIVVALKGNYIKNFADHARSGAEIETLADIETYCTTEQAKQTDFDHYD